MITIRPATWDDLDACMALEAHWPEGQRAAREQFEARLDKMPEGFLVAAAQDGLAGSITACAIRYQPNHPEAIGDWRCVTNDGSIRYRREVPGANALYVVSAIVHPAYRGRDLFKRMVLQEVEVARALGLSFVTAGAVIPGYHAYCRTHGPVAAPDYVFTRKGRRVADPFLEQYRQIGFFVPDKAHVLADYYDDSDSENHAALVVHEVVGR